MIYGRINLEQTNYSILNKQCMFIQKPNFEELDIIYTQYCMHKQFKSVMPMFESEFTDPSNDVIGYYDEGKLVAWSLIRKFDHENVEAIQFAWNYANPKLALGIKSLRNECALYKMLGYKYLYLGEATEYKRKIDGFEVLGPR